MNNDKYISYAGFTIGPIYEVLTHVKKTREVWLGSYFFSWYMEKMIIALSECEIEFIVPYIEKPIKESHDMVGKYHDRFILKSSLVKEELFTRIKNASEKTMQCFVNLIDEIIKQNMYILGKNNVKEILEDYIQRNFVVLDASCIDDKNEVKSVERYIDAMEERRIFNLGAVDNTCFRCKMLTGVAERKLTQVESHKEQDKERCFCPLCYLKIFCNESTSLQTKVAPQEKEIRFPSVVAIACRGFYDIPKISAWSKRLKKEEVNWKDIEDEEFEFKDLEALVSYYNKGKQKNEKVHIQNYYKYYAVLQADGDSLGKLISGDTKPDELSNELSKRLFEFASVSEKIIKAYRGEPIFIGGDDVLAFVPVISNISEVCLKTIMDLACELSEEYIKIVGNGSLDATLSVGINIAYNKFPLSTALKNARGQLFDKAKKKEGKNCLAISLTKHSGFQINIDFGFNDSDLRLFSELMGKLYSGVVDIPSTIYHNLSRSKTVLKNIPQDDNQITKDDNQRLKAFFDNNFNESVHSKFYEGIKFVREIFEKSVLVYEHDEKDGKIDNFLNKLYFVNFLRGETE